MTGLCDVFAADGGNDAYEILEKLGRDVDFTTHQTCCGQPAFNSDYIEDSKKAMKQMMKAFVHSKYVVCPSGSCAGMVKEYPKIFKGDPVWEPRAKKLANK